LALATPAKLSDVTPNFRTGLFVHQQEVLTFFLIQLTAQGIGNASGDVQLTGYALAYICMTKICTCACDPKEWTAEPETPTDETSSVLLLGGAMRIPTTA